MECATVNAVTTLVTSSSVGLKAARGLQAPASRRSTDGSSSAKRKHRWSHPMAMWCTPWASARLNCDAALMEVKVTWCVRWLVVKAVQLPPLSPLTESSPRCCASTPKSSA